MRETERKCATLDGCCSLAFSSWDLKLEYDVGPEVLSRMAPSPFASVVGKGASRAALYGEVSGGWVSLGGRPAKTAAS